jgi:hypothetical protein
MLLDTIKAIVDESALRDFIIKDADLRRRYEKSDQGIVSNRIDLSSDVLEAVWKRLYAIRNRLTHAKDGFDERIFIPFSDEATELIDDVSLIKFLAQRALEKMSESLPNS